MFEHPHSTIICFDSYNSFSCKIIDKTNSKFELKIEEALQVNWRKPNLNTQQNLVALTVSQKLPSPRYSFLSLFFCLCLSSVTFINVRDCQRQ